MGLNRLPSGISLALLAVLAACAARTAGAETLADAWQLAIAHDQGLAAVISEVEGARASEQAARGARWPSVEASGGYTRLNASPALDVTTPAFSSGPIFKGDDYVNGTVQMRLLLYTGGQVSAGIQSSLSSAAEASINPSLP
jgi:outer membrane protein